MAIASTTKRVERLMADNALYAIDGRRSKVRTTVPDVSAPTCRTSSTGTSAPANPEERTCGDITYSPPKRWLYLVNVLD